MISPHLREEIRLKHEKVKNNPAYYDQRLKLVKESLRSSGDVYSFWIENPTLRIALVKGNKQPETVKKEARKGIQSIHNAWYFLSKIGEYGNFISLFDAGTIKGTNGLVNGLSKDKGEYRSGNVTLGIVGFRPPAPKDIKGHVDLAIEVTKLKHEQDPLDAAIHLHIALAYIQPFDEGNKRTARLLQDRLLWDFGLPPAIITAGEAKFYFDLIKRSAEAFWTQNEEGQKQFYDYNASKVNNGLDLILDDLEN